MKSILYILAFIIIVLSSCTKQELIAPKETSPYSGVETSVDNYSRTGDSSEDKDDEPDSVIGGDEKEEDDDNDSSGDNSGSKIIKGEDDGPSVIGGDEKEEDDDNDSKNK